jgi:hypothetical protein
MVIVACIYLRSYIEFGVGVGTFLLTPTPPKIPSDSDATALNHTVFMWTSPVPNSFQNHGKNVEAMAESKLRF